MNAAMYAKGKGVVADIDIWHKRIGHANVQRLKLMQSKGLVKGLPTFKVAEFHKICEACQFGKQARQPFSRARDVSRNILDVVHTEVWEPTQNVSLGGSKYFVTFINDCSRKLWVYFMKEKSDVFEHFKTFKAVVETEIGLKDKCLRSDGGGEYLSNEFSNFLRSHGIKRHFTCRYTPQQNGVA